MPRGPLTAASSSTAWRRDFAEEIEFVRRSQSVKKICAYQSALMCWLIETMAWRSLESAEHDMHEHMGLTLYRTNASSVDTYPRLLGKHLHPRAAPHAMHDAMRKLHATIAGAMQRAVEEQAFDALKDCVPRDRVWLLLNLIILTDIARKLMH
jgi:hypothetical protein